jgi:hypothetical protein
MALAADLDIQRLALVDLVALDIVRDRDSDLAVSKAQ